MKLNIFQHMYRKKKPHMNTKKVFKLVNQIKDLGELLVEHPNS